MTSDNKLVAPEERQPVVDGLSPGLAGTWSGQLPAAYAWAGFEGNCPSSGESRVEHLSGEIWPLEVGKKLRYSVTGTSSLFAKAWRSKRECTVVSTVRISTVTGEFDRFKVVCKARWGTRTWWLSPKVGTAVAYQQTTRRGGYLLQDMTRIVKP